MFLLTICRSNISNLKSVRLFNSKFKLISNKNVQTSNIINRNITTSKISLQLNNRTNNQFYRSSNTSTSTLNTVLYTASGIILMVGLTYAAVPLYKMFCESTGYELNNKISNASDEELKNRMAKLQRNSNRILKVKFTASKSADLKWNFEPQQDEINLAIGETSLAFYRAKNLTNRPIIGIATYNILPFEAGLFFNKIQCFCFEEQRLEPGEEVDMPVFFFIDDEFANEPLLENVDTICLSYTFFESRGSIDLASQLPQLPRKFLQ